MIVFATAFTFADLKAPSAHFMSTISIYIIAATCSTALPIFSERVISTSATDKSILIFR